MLTKKSVLKSIKELPEEFSVDEIIDRIILLQKIDSGMEQSIAGNIHSTSTAKNKLKKWLK